MQPSPDNTANMNNGTDVADETNHNEVAAAMAADQHATAAAVVADHPSPADHANETLLSAMAAQIAEDNAARAAFSRRLIKFVQKYDKDERPVSVDIFVLSIHLRTFLSLEVLYRWLYATKTIEEVERALRPQ